MKISANQNVKVLVIDDELSIRQTLSMALTDEGYEVELANSGEDGLKKLKQLRPQVVFLDIWMPGGIDGIEVLKQSKSLSLETEFIIMSGHGTIETAVQATRLGAWDFIEKPLSIDKISILMKNIVSYQKEKGEKAKLLHRLRKNIAIVGESEKLRQLKQMMSRMAMGPNWLVLTGERGTGKELIAENIHYLSSRASQSFVRVNCRAIPEELMAGELFGYDQGAFAGMDRVKMGKLELADQGTLYLEDAEALSHSVQARLLKLLKEGVIRREGGDGRSYSVDVRVIFSSHKWSDEGVDGPVLPGLYHRLSSSQLTVPSLRERREDIPLLLDHFADQFCREAGFDSKLWSGEAQRAVVDYAWPGNIRELKNFVERVYILTPGLEIGLDDLRFAGLDMDSGVTDELSFQNFREARAQFEREFLLKKIAENDGNISRTAESIGIERSHLHRKIKAYGIDA